MTQKSEAIQAGKLIGNLGEPLRLKKVELGGFSIEAARPGEMVKVQVSGGYSTLDPLFHRLVGNFSKVLHHSLHESGQAAHIDRANVVLLVIKPDKSAELWIDTAAVAAERLAKRDLKAGQAVFQKDIADIRAMRFPHVDIGSEDQVACIFRQGWHFGYAFDFNPERQLDLARFEITLGWLRRRLEYWEIYETISNGPEFTKLVEAGWFPFVEIIGPEFQQLADASKSGFSLEDAEAKLVESFDEERLNHLLQRWIKKPHLAKRKPILESAIKSFLSENPVAVIKTVLTEIEGALADAHEAKKGKKAKLKTLLEFAADEARQKTGSDDSLFLPAAFAEYLKHYTFKNFDPQGPAGQAGSRHAVGHGAASADSYTMAAALQALLTLDQFAFYTG